MFLCLIQVCVLILILILLCVGMVELGLCWYMWIDFVLDNLVYVYIHKWIDFVCTIFIYDFFGFDFLVFLCLIFWVCMISFLGLCYFVFLMKRMANLNSCILGSNFFFHFFFVKIDKLISKSKVDVDAYVSFFNHYFMLMWYF